MLGQQWLEIAVCASVGLNNSESYIPFAKYRKNSGQLPAGIPTISRPDSKAENASVADAGEKQDAASCCQLAGKNIQNLNARNPIKAKRPPTSTSTIRISMQASCFCYFRCAPRLLTLFLLSHSGSPIINASIARFILTFGASI